MPLNKETKTESEVDCFKHSIIHGRKIMSFVVLLVSSLIDVSILFFFQFSISRF